MYWLATLLSAVAVFLLSFVMHMVLPWHHGDYKTVPNEAQLMDAVRSVGVPPGDYMVLRPSGRDEMRSPEFAEKMRRGPVMVLTVLPGGQFSWARNLVGWFIYVFIVAAIAGHIAARVDEGDHYLVFHSVALSAFLGYAAALWQMTIWYRRSWATTLRSTIDGLIYALVTGFIFAWLMGA